MSRDTKRPQHPSGKPLRRDDYRRVGFSRRPPDEPLTPGLRREEGANAIGFMHRFDNDQED